MAILRDLQPLTGKRQHVFVGRDPKKPMSDAAVNAALRRMGYDTRTEITGHGFRAMVRTILHEEFGVDHDVIEHQPAHRVPDALGETYSRTRFLKERRVMMQRRPPRLPASAASGEPPGARRQPLGFARQVRLLELAQAGHFLVIFVMELWRAQQPGTSFQRMIINER
ncbi:tyrosine-type recombinase/integrase [Thauera sinica]|uniref:Tyrosine-type recombinase/integrase n=1 Tax=Thauera sinica TaxID=2665146 RepID=A0ABW1ANB5_9RHOO|nr:hypothetical protein [Thauera sp. K11]